MNSVNVDHEKLFTIDQVSSLTNIPASTIRKYVSKYREILTIHRGKRNQKLFAQETMSSLVRIRSWVAERKSPKEIKSMLTGQGICGLGRVSESLDKPNTTAGKVPHGQDLHPVALGHHLIEIQATMSTFSNLVRNMGQDIEDLKKQNSKLDDENRELKEQIKTQSDNQTQILEWIDNQSIWKTIKKMFGKGSQ